MNFLNLYTTTDPIVEISEQSKELQRTEQWHADRLGKFTGSKIKELMSCSRSTAEMPWGRPEKLIDFGQAAKKYVYSRARERETGIAIKIKETKAMKYGTAGEEIVKELLKNKYPRATFEEVGFLEFITGVAGASPDWKATQNNKSMGVEIKCSTNYDTEYSRLIEAFEQKHQDFWQVQTEMMALKVNKMLYVVAAPTENMNYEDIKEITVKPVDASPIHQNAIYERCLISEAVIKDYFETQDFNESFYKILSNYEHKN